MNFFVGYLVGFWNTIRSFKMWLLVYAIVVGFALLFAMPIFQVMEGAVGNSLEVEKLLPGYDNTVYRDFMNVHGDKFAGTRSQIIWSIPFFLLLFVFLTGGILASFSTISEPFSFGSFWSACSRHFWKILGVFSVMTILQGLLAGLIYAPFFKWVGESFYEAKSEMIYVKVIIALVVLHLILATFLATVSDYAKIKMVQEDRRSWLRELWSSFGWTRKNFFKVYPLYLLNALTAAVLIAVYWFLEDKIGMVSVTTIVLMFLIQQAFIFLRLGTKLTTLASATAMYQAVQEKQENH